MQHAIIRQATQRIATAARAAGKHWGMPIFSTEHAREVLELGGRFLCYSADLLMVKAGLEAMQQQFAPLGLSFERRV
jgi:2-keto-3-deoxy-L-rhamnonate aldolase RhmA